MLSVISNLVTKENDLSIIHRSYSSMAWYGISQNLQINGLYSQTEWALLIIARLVV